MIFDAACMALGLSSDLPILSVGGKIYELRDIYGGELLDTHSDVQAAVYD